MATPAEELLRHIRRLVSRPASASDTDAALLARFTRDRDEAAFADLVARHGGMVLGVCRRVLRDHQAAEDVAQATWLVLARKAATIRRPRALPAWLHGVARHLALKCRRADERRRQREARGVEGGSAPRQPHPLDELTARELLLTLDEELQALPEAYRLPVILCALEGHTAEQAAEHLGWTPGSVRARLVRGRKRLHARLVRRGLELSVALAALEAVRAVAPAGMPAVGAFAVARAAVAFAAANPGEVAAAGGVSAKVVALAEGLMEGMAVAKLKVGLVLALAVGVATAGAGAVAHQVLGAKQLEARQEAGAKPVTQEAAKRAEGEKQAVRTDRYGDPLPPGAVARLGSLRLYHGQRVERVILSPDGRLVVSSGAGGNRLWDAATGKELPLRAELTHATLFPARDKLVAVQLLPPRRLHIWDVAAGRQVSELVLDQQVGLFSLSPDGKTLVVWGLKADLRPALRFCDAAAGKVGEPISLAHSAKVAQLAFSADGRTLVLQYFDHTIHVWDVGTRSERLASRAGQADYSGFIALSPDGTTLSTAPPPGKRIRLWDTRTLQELPPLLDQPGQVVQPMTFSPDGKLLAVTYPSSSVRLWDLATRKVVRQVRCQGYQVFHTAFSADGKTLAAADGDSVTVWDVATGRPRHDFGHTYCVNAIHFSPDGKRLVSGAAYTDNVVRLWDPFTGRQTGQLRGHADGIEAIAYTPDGRLVASGSQDGTVRLWDAASGREVRRLEAHDGMVYGMAFAPDGKMLAAGGRQKAVHLWDVPTGRELRSFDNPGGWVLRLAFSPDGKMIATRGIDERGIRLWDVTKGKQIRQLSGQVAGCPSLAFTPDGKGLASGDDGTVLVWDVFTGEKHSAFTTLSKGRQENDARVLCVAISPDGRSLAAGCDDRTVRLWEVASGQERARYTGHRGDITSVAFSSDGRLLASGGCDRTVLVWDVTGRVTAGRQPTEPTAKELAARWADLGGADPVKAYLAAQALLRANEQAVRLLRERLPPAAPADDKRIGRLIVDLNSDQFAVREKAARELRGQGEAAEPALRKALARNLSVEQRRRVTEALEALAPARSTERLRLVRAVEVLEHLGTREARQVLEALVRGAPEARLTREAKASLQRLARRTAPKP